MRIIILYLILHCHSAFAQESTFYVISNNVNFEDDTTSTTKSKSPLNWGTKLQLKKISINWYAKYDPYIPDYYYINAKYLADYDSFISKAKTLENPNSVTKYELMKFFLDEDSSIIALKYFEDIVNNHAYEPYSVFRESCPLIGTITFYTFCERKSNKAQAYESIIKVSKDSLILSLTYLAKGQLALKSGNLLDAENIYFKIMEDYSNHLFVPLECDYDYESKIYPRLHLKDQLLTLYAQADLDQQRRIRQQLENMNNSQSTVTQNISKAILKDI